MNEVKLRDLPSLIARAPVPRPLPPSFEANKWKPGQSGNPGGKPSSPDYKRCRELCREHSPDAAAEIIRLFQHSDDDRVRFMAAQWTYEQAWGKAPPYDPAAEKPPSSLDLGKLSPDQRSQLRELLTKAVAVPTVGADVGTAVELSEIDNNIN